VTSSSKRAETLLLLARQLSEQHGLVWARLSQGGRARLLTFAGNLLATVERRAEVDWKEAPSEDNRG
jgi:hypothetical protein